MASFSMEPLFLNSAQFSKKLEIAHHREDLFDNPVAYTAHERWFFHPEAAPNSSSWLITTRTVDSYSSKSWASCSLLEFVTSGCARFRQGHQPAIPQHVNEPAVDHRCMPYRTPALSDLSGHFAGDDAAQSRVTQRDQDHLFQLIMRKTETHERFQIGQQPRMGTLQCRQGSDNC
jgi:hypothetical protein